MKKSIGFLALAITVMFSFSSCSKDKESTPSQEELISERAWIATAFTRTNPATGTIDDMYAPMTPCYRDDQWIFSANGAHEANAGTTKCSPSDPQVFRTGNWRFKDGGATFELVITASVSGVGTYNYKVEELTRTKLHLSIVDGGYKYDTYFGH